jgi:beta-glucanase (GH16 family)
MKKYLFLLILLSSIQGKAQFTSLLWSDEFTEPTITKANWKYDLGVGSNGWGNNELEYYTSRAENVNIADGNLRIIARKESYGGRAYTSARMKTQGLQEFTYGKVEARIKAPVGQGIWPAFWMLSKNITSVGWPKCGEIDILEHVNNSKDLNGTLHWDNNNAHAQHGLTTPCDVTKWHVYGLEWDANAIKLFLDGRKYFEMKITNNVGHTEEFHQPFFLILNLAVGGNWPGPPNSTTLFPDTLFVDYVRVYGLSTGTAELDNDPSADHSLGQNYPNPFNQSTTISFNLPLKSNVSLVVINASGQEVASIESSELPAGNHTRQWDASGFPGGIYYYRLKAGGLTETKKLILLR